MKFNLNILFTVLLAIVLLLTACDNGGPTEPDKDYTAILSNLGTGVILKTYEDLRDRAAALQVATTALEANPTADNLTAARAAWVAARSPWEQSEGFLFGPVDQEGLDPSLDSWPVNVTDLNNVLGGSDNLTAAFLAAQEGTLKGFHTIEFLLWGETSTKTVGDFTPREYEYLAAAAAALALDATQLYTLWAPTEGNFVANVTKAGAGSVVYISQKSALEEISNALVIIADEVGNGKINEPFALSDLNFEESRFSANSKADFADNMRSIRNIYLGTYQGGGDGNGISTIVKTTNTTLDTRIQAEIEAAIAAIEAIPGTFSDAVFNNRPAIQQAQTAVRTLQATLEADLVPLISNL